MPSFPQCAKNSGSASGSASGGDAASQRATVACLSADKVNALADFLASLK